ncbi:MAG: 1-acyl-sn-glycerol-3-phosphate acyltransferase [Candidatus Amulumruptor caecigallinarius]|nr:1-acyl-sn-glycerol-3-phosphate acyltransferase [Candidatus Amulumruptor caecigallinarius]MCM1396656.1 1-acyl-sn-glycerol-3-phosphate acyltransferase [Candidatus Amulumruptor caecigallinarius]MCM1453286.1 1-acyl-sn-glycerol-3-phosphate acyltransferase [bacterium]
MLTLLYRIYLVLVMAPLSLVVTILTALTTIVACALGGGRWWGYYPEILWSRIVLALTLVRVKVRRNGQVSADTSYVFVANHQSSYDIFTIYGYLGHNFRWLMKRSLRKIPLIGYSCEKSGQVFVDRSSPSAIRRTMVEAEQRLAGGMSIVVFPEGSRTFTGKLQPFKRGAYTLAMEFGLPVVPVTIDGAFRVLPRTARWPRWGTITLTIHAPIFPGPDGHHLPTLMASSEAAIASAL